MSTLRNSKLDHVNTDEKLQITFNKIKTRTQKLLGQYFDRINKLKCGLK